MRKIYYYVSECPRCGSASTGYFLYDPGGNFLDDTKREAKALKNGEIQSIRHEFRTLNSPSCFCMNCRIEWRERPKTLLLSKNEIEKEKQRRGITDGSISELESYKDVHRIREGPVLLRVFRKIVSYLTNQ